MITSGGNIASSLIGMTEEEARKKAESLRYVVHVQHYGMKMVLTTDYRTDRITLCVRDGRVTSASIG